MILQDNFPLKNILLIDDNPVILKILSKCLRNKCFNFNVITFINPKRAIDLIKNKERNYFDLILTDIEMLEMTGIELARYIRENLKIAKSELPILVYSSREDLGTIKEAELAGCNDYYVKPKNAEFIARNISKWLLNDYVPKENIYHQKIVVNEDTFRDLNIIIADDQTMNLMIMAKKFQEFGANVFKCFDGAEMVDLVEKNPVKYHLIVTDIYMNKMGGVEAMKLIRAIQLKYNKKYGTSYRIPIVAISGEVNKNFIMRTIHFTFV